MRKPIIVGNWKMYKTPSEAKDMVSQLKGRLSGIKKVEIGVSPPFVDLAGVAEVLRDTRIYLAAQDVHWEKEGAFTGEISAGMLLEIGCRFCIIGHSERRSYFNETDEMVNKKMNALLDAGLIPIVCIGETLPEREQDITEKVIDRQLSGSLANLTSSEAEKIVIAYEPVWAIGTGKTATPAQAQEVHGFIRKRLQNMFGKETAEKMRIQYGGSVKPENISELMKQIDIDGALVGGASLKTDSFAAIVLAADHIQEE